MSGNLTLTLLLDRKVELMAQKAISKEVGTCIWFKNAYGYIGYGLYTNQAYEGQIYAHYKNIPKKGHRNHHTSLSAGDICEFTFGEGYFCNGTQAVDIKVIAYAQDNDQHDTSEECSSEVESMG